MKTLSKLVLSTMLLLANSFLYSQQEHKDDEKTLSPYFYIPTEDTETERLPLKSTSANVYVAGVIADVTITQEYKNEGKKPIEAVYVFPASTRAAVHSMVMTIGKRVKESWPKPGQLPLEQVLIENRFA